MRNFEKAIKDGEKILTKRTSIDINNGEIARLMKKFDPEHITESLFCIIADSYKAGIAVGMRNQK